MPDWYTLMRAAKYLGVSPWDLDEQPVYWMERALAAEEAESEVQHELQRQAERSMKR